VDNQDTAPGQSIAELPVHNLPVDSQCMEDSGLYPVVIVGQRPPQGQQANYNMAPGLQMMNPRGATTAAPRGPSASRSSKPQSQQQQQSVNQNLAMVRITGR
jgi:hypothetical protein